MEDQKKRIAVIFGGCSGEYGISLQSAYGVIDNLNRELYEAVLIGITEEGEWFLYEGDAEKILADTWIRDESLRRAIISPSRDMKGVIVFENRGMRMIELDAAFPVLHGKNGEDGTVQGLLELAGIPVVGCGMRGSAVCMDKGLAHSVAAQAGIRVPKGIVLQKWDVSAERLSEAAKEIGYPIFVKPVNGGSSLGLDKVDSDGRLMKAAVEALRYDDEIILEETIPGFEVGCAILGNSELTVGEADEIEIHDEFFGFVEKYTQEHSKIHTPARLPQEERDKIKAVSTAIYRALGCRGYARVDLFYTPDGEIIFNEVNTIPGLTVHSRFPKMLEGVGISYGEFVDRVIALALNQ